MTCPSCKLENPNSAQRCDCGYPFTTSEATGHMSLGGRSCSKCNIVNPLVNRYCGQCGSLIGAKPTPYGKIALAAIVAIVVLGILGGRNHSEGTVPTSVRSPTVQVVRGHENQKEEPTPREEPKPGLQWSYSDHSDAMGRKKSFASVTSGNVLEFDFPYKGPQHATLTIRKSAQFGIEATVNIERGQFLCRFDGCAVNVRFDDGKIRQFSANEPSDHRTTMLFLEGAPAFVAHLRKSKVVRIEATFYHEGTQAMEFNVAGFEWPT